MFSSTGDIGSKKRPDLFANRVIRQTVDNLAGPDRIVLLKDYRTMRTVFRTCGGAWEQLVLGDIVHTGLLTQIVQVWVGMKQKR